MQYAKETGVESFRLRKKKKDAGAYTLSESGRVIV